jgi:hypothetical protein
VNPNLDECRNALSSSASEDVHLISYLAAAADAQGLVYVVDRPASSCMPQRFRHLRARSGRIVSTWIIEGALEQAQNMARPALRQTVTSYYEDCGGKSMPP